MTTGSTLDSDSGAPQAQLQRDSVPRGTATGRRHRHTLTARLMVLFFASGASALIYETVWLRMLERALGVAVIAVSTILAVFMFGLALGARAAGSLADRSANPLRAYAFIEIALALCALLSTAILGVLPGWVAGTGDVGGVPGTVLAAAAHALILLPATVLMGATLPVLTAFVETGSGAGRDATDLYGANTLGAMAGVGMAGFVLIAAMGEKATVGLAAGMNVLVGVAALCWSARHSVPVARGAAESAGTAESPPGPFTPGALAFLAALGGFCALAFEVVWTRQMQVVVGNSTYGFSAMLAAYLLGIAVGAALIAKAKQSLPWVGLAPALMAIGGPLSLGLMAIIGLVESNPHYLYSRVWSVGDFAVLPLHALLVIAPTTVLSGVAFGALTRASVTLGRSAAHGVAAVYTANTLGGIAGSLASGFLMVPVLGTARSLLVSAALSLVAGLWAANRLRAISPWHSRTAWVGAAVFVALVVIVPGDPLLRTVAGRLAPGARVLFHREDAAATVTVVDTGTARNVLVNGLHVSGTGAGNRIPFVGVPTAFVPAPKRMLMVGLGAAEAAYGAQEQGLEVTVAELVPAMVEATRFTQPERPSLRDSGIRVILTDGRNFVLRTHEQFDVILVDISPPIFSSGAANLYSREFLELARGRLSEDGVMALWLPAVCFADDIWRVAAGFVSVFPEAIIWAQPRTAGALFLGARRDGALDASSPLLEARLRERGLAYPDGGAFDADCLRRGVVIGPAALRAFVAGFPPLTDDRPYTEFPLARFIRGERLWLDNLYLVQASQPVSTPPLPAVRQGVAPR